MNCVVHYSVRLYWCGGRWARLHCYQAVRGSLHQSEVGPSSRSTTATVLLSVACCVPVCADQSKQWERIQGIFSPPYQLCKRLKYLSRLGRRLTLWLALWLSCWCWTSDIQTCAVRPQSSVESCRWPNHHHGLVVRDTPTWRHCGDPWGPRSSSSSSSPSTSATRYSLVSPTLSTRLMEKCKYLPLGDN